MEENKVVKYNTNCILTVFKCENYVYISNIEIL